MSFECYECEHDLRGPHDPSCSRYKPPPKCPKCGNSLKDGDGYLYCSVHGEVNPKMSDAPKLCEDEGCPHFDTDHVCIDRDALIKEQAD